MRPIVSLVVAYALFSAGCRPPIDTDRESVDTGSFGQTVTTLMCKRVAYLEDLADGGTTDVRGDDYRDICRLGLAPPDDAPASLKALLANYDTLVDATDTMFPDAFLDTLQTFLTSNDFLATYDEGGSLVPAVDALIGLFRLIGDDPEATAALERLNIRLGYKPLGPALGAIRAAIRYPEMHDLLLSLAHVITEGGAAKAEWDDLVAALGATLRHASISGTPDDPDRTGRLALDLLLPERALLGTSKVIPLVIRDPRGLAEPAAVGSVFVDMDGDGNADVNAVGQYVDASGNVLAVPAPFPLPEGSDEVVWPDRDLEGRPLDAPDGNLLYDYVDLDKTVLAALARDAVQLFDPSKGTAMDLLRGASALMGTRVEMTRTFDDGVGTPETLTYRGYDLEQSALLDMLYGFLQVLRSGQIYDILGLAKTLVVDHPAETARLAEALISSARFGDMHPEAVIPADAPLWDDLIPVIRQVLANANLTTGLLRAMENVKVKDLGERFRKYMTYKDRFDIDPNTQAVTGTFTTPVDRTAEDSHFNRSLFQRILHVINDSNGATACNKQDAQVKDPFVGITLGTYDECELFSIDNLAVFYLQSIAYAKNGAGQYICETNDGGDFDSTTTASTPEGCVSQGRRPQPKADFNYNWGGFVGGSIDTFGGDGFLEDTVGIEGMRTHPTPNALNRVLFLDPTPAYLTNIIDPMKDKDGDFYKTQHAGTLPVWEVEGFYDQIRPIVQVFADNNAEQLMVDFLSVLHKYWPTEDSLDTQNTSSSSPNYSYAAGANSYEPLVAQILENGAILDTLVDIAPTLDAITVNGKNYTQIAREAARFLLDPLPGLTDRAGNTTSTQSDGDPVAVLSPWQVLADAYAKKTARLAQAGTEGAAWTDSVSEVVDVLLRGLDVPTVGWQFKNPRFRGVSAALIDFLVARLQAHDQAGDRATWVSTDMPADLQDLLSGPVFAGAADFILSLQQDPETRTQLDSLMNFLVDELATDGDGTFRASITAIADLLQLNLSDADIAPLARVAGQALDPSRGWLDANLEFVRDARESDENEALVTMLINMYEETSPGRTAVGDLIDGISEVHRAEPYDDLGKRYTAADFASLMHGLADFLDEEKRGLRKFIAIIRDRNL